MLWLDDKYRRKICDRDRYGRTADSVGGRLGGWGVGGTKRFGLEAGRSHSSNEASRWKQFQGSNGMVGQALTVVQGVHESTDSVHQVTAQSVLRAR